MEPANSITVISSPYHFGAQVAVGLGPGTLLAAGLCTALQNLGITVHQIEIPPVDDSFEGEVVNPLSYYAAHLRSLLV